MFEHSDGPRHIPYDLPVWVIVRFKESTFAGETKWWPDLDKTLIPINPKIIRYEKNCCTITSIPSRICKEITIHKSQGMSIGPGKPFESVIVFLPERGERNNPVSKLVPFSRVTDISALAICDTNKEITIKTLKNIGTGSNYIKRNKFDKFFEIKKTISRRIVKDNITKLNIVKGNEKQFFWGGSDFLLQ